VSVVLDFRFLRLGASTTTKLVRKSACAGRECRDIPSRRWGDHEKHRQLERCSILLWVQLETVIHPARPRNGPFHLATRDVRFAHRNGCRPTFFDGIEAGQDESLN